jgi:hypothetical protein
MQSLVLKNNPEFHKNINNLLDSDDVDTANLPESWKKDSQFLEDQKALTPYVYGSLLGLIFIIFLAMMHLYSLNFGAIREIERKEQTKNKMKKFENLAPEKL